MSLSQKLIKKYQKLHKRKFGENISEEESEEALNNLADFFQLLLDVDKRNNPKNYLKR